MRIHLPGGVPVAFPIPRARETGSSRAEIRTIGGRLQQGLALSRDRRHWRQLEATESAEYFEMSFGGYSQPLALPYEETGYIYLISDHDCDYELQITNTNET